MWHGKWKSPCHLLLMLVCINIILCSFSLEVAEDTLTCDGSQLQCMCIEVCMHIAVGRSLHALTSDRGLIGHWRCPVPRAPHEVPQKCWLGQGWLRGQRSSLLTARGWALYQFLCLLVEAEDSLWPAVNFNVYMHINRYLCALEVAAGTFPPTGDGLYLFLSLQWKLQRWGMTWCEAQSKHNGGLILVLLLQLSLLKNMYIQTKDGYCTASSTCPLSLVASVSFSLQLT